MIRSPLAMMITLMMVACVYWLWIGLAQRSVQTDPGISILAAQGILEHGYPRLPSGYLYARGYVHSYVLAASMWLFGQNEFAIRLPSLLAGIGALVMVFLIGGRVLNDTASGVLASVWLVLSSAQADIATYTRMYIFLQLFTLLAAFAAWRGFVEDHPKYRWITVVVLLAAIGTHRFGAILVGGIVGAIALVKFLEAGRARDWSFGWSEVALLALIPVGILTVFLDPPGAAESIAVHGGMEMDRMGLDLSLQSWRGQLGHFERMFPFTLFLLPLTLFPAYHALVRPSRKCNLGILYLSVIFGVSVVALVALLQASAVRYVIFVAPIYILLIVSSVLYLWRHRDVVPRVALVAGGIVWLLGSVGAVLAANTPYISGAYGVPCSESASACHVRIKQTYQQLRSAVSPNDRIISDVPWVTNYYLGRVDGFLRQARLDGDFGAFDSPTDEYFGIQLIDTRAELLESLGRGGRTWVIIDNNLVSRFVSDEFLQILDERLLVHTRNESLTAYVTR